MAGMATVPTVAEHVHRDEDGVAYFCWMIQGLREAFASERRSPLSNRSAISASNLHGVISRAVSGIKRIEQRRPIDQRRRVCGLNEPSRDSEVQLCLSGAGRHGLHCREGKHHHGNFVEMW